MTTRYSSHAQQCQEAPRRELRRHKSSRANRDGRRCTRQNLSDEARRHRFDKPEHWRLKAFYNWAIEREYVAENPAQRIHKLREFERERRLEPGEEERLRALTRDDWLWRLRIVAALETGCRIGELLNVQFKQLRWDLNELTLSNRTTKGLRTRYVPLSQELRAMLDLRRYDPDGQQFGPDAYVFGNEVGERVRNYQKAWSTLRLRAIGHGPHWGPYGRFRPCCREQLAKLNLHMHDLRREAGSRLLERGADLHTVQLFPRSREYLDEQPLPETVEARAPHRDSAHRRAASREW